jgi:hypothetical protein
VTCRPMADHVRLLKHMFVYTHNPSHPGSTYILHSKGRQLTPTAPPLPPRKASTQHNTLPTTKSLHNPPTNLRLILPKTTPGFSPRFTCNTTPLPQRSHSPARPRPAPPRLRLPRRSASHRPSRGRPAISSSVYWG